MASTTLSPHSSHPTHLCKSMDVATLSETIAEILERIPNLKTTTSGTRLSSTDSDQLQVLLTKMQSAVRREKQTNHAQSHVPRWLRQLKAVVNDLNDLVEELSGSADASTKARTARVSSIFKPNFIRNRHKIITRKISTVIPDLQGVANAINFPPEEAPKEETKLAITKDEMNKLEAVGRENEKKEIIYKLNLFFNKKKGKTTAVPVSVPVVTIVGVAGIGKTKLARLVYQDMQVKNHFAKRIWIRVKFDVESITKRLPVLAATGGKRYLVVLDDVRIEIGDKILMQLQQKLMGPGGAILITTRSHFVANKTAASICSNLLANKIAACPNTVKPYVLQGLKEEESWSLFERIRGQGSISSDIKRMIVRDCGGVPPLIITTASLLKNGETQVEELKAQLLKLLKLNYCDTLPTRQKLCFAYCSLFSPNHLFDPERLIHLWMAEGFVNANNSIEPKEIRWYFRDFLSIDSIEPEEICRLYFSDFLAIQDVKEDECGVVKSFKMNPLMHDLACFVTDEEENITMDTNGTKVQETVLRASFDFSLDIPFEIPNSLFDKAKKLRSILLLTNTQSQLSQELKVSTSTCDKIFKNFERLRMLDLHDLGIKTVPTSIGELDNLRYLDVSNNNIEKLPSSITKLSKLETFKLSHCHHLKELPKNFEDLISLRHLVIEGCLALTHMPRKINKLSSLQTLSIFVVSKDYHNGGLGELASLNSLRGHLQILHLERLKFPAPDKVYLERKKHLQQLTLRWNLVDEEEEEDHQHQYQRSTVFC